MFAGASSDWYIGTVLVSMPVPIPSSLVWHKVQVISLVIPVMKRPTIMGATPYAEVCKIAPT